MSSFYDLFQSSSAAAAAFKDNDNDSSSSSSDDDDSSNKRSNDGKKKKSKNNKSKTKKRDSSSSSSSSSFGKAHTSKKIKQESSSSSSSSNDNNNNQPPSSSSFTPLDSFYNNSPSTPLLQTTPITTSNKKRKHSQLTTTTTTPKSIEQAKLLQIQSSLSKSRRYKSRLAKRRKRSRKFSSVDDIFHSSSSSSASSSASSSSLSSGELREMEEKRYEKYKLLKIQNKTRNERRRRFGNKKWDLKGEVDYGGVVGRMERLVWRRRRVLEEEEEVRKRKEKEKEKKEGEERRRRKLEEEERRRKVEREKEEEKERNDEGEEEDGEKIEAQPPQQAEEKAVQGEEVKETKIKEEPESSQADNEESSTSSLSTTSSSSSSSKKALGTLLTRSSTLLAQDQAELDAIHAQIKHNTKRSKNTTSLHLTQSRLQRFKYVAELEEEYIQKNSMGGDGEDFSSSQLLYMRNRGGFKRGSKGYLEDGFMAPPSGYRLEFDYEKSLRGREGLLRMIKEEERMVEEEEEKKESSGDGIPQTVQWEETLPSDSSPKTSLTKPTTTPKPSPSSSLLPIPKLQTKPSPKNKKKKQPPHYHHHHPYNLPLSLYNPSLRRKYLSSTTSSLVPHYRDIRHYFNPTLLCHSIPFGYNASRIKNCPTGGCTVGTLGFVTGENGTRQRLGMSNVGPTPFLYHAKNLCNLLLRSLYSSSSSSNDNFKQCIKWMEMVHKLPSSFPYCNSIQTQTKKKKKKEEEGVPTRASIFYTYARERAKCRMFYDLISNDLDTFFDSSSCSSSHLKIIQILKRELGVLQNGYQDEPLLACDGWSGLNGSSLRSKNRRLMNSIWRVLRLRYFSGREVEKKEEERSGGVSVEKMVREEEEERNGRIKEEEEEKEEESGRRKKRRKKVVFDLKEQDTDLDVTKTSNSSKEGSSSSSSSSKHSKESKLTSSSSSSSKSSFTKKSPTQQPTTTTTTTTTPILIKREQQQDYDNDIPNTNQTIQQQQPSLSSSQEKKQSYNKKIISILFPRTTTINTPILPKPTLFQPRSSLYEYKLPHVLLRHALMQNTKRVTLCGMLNTKEEEEEEEMRKVKEKPDRYAFVQHDSNMDLSVVYMMVIMLLKELCCARVQAKHDWFYYSGSSNNNMLEEEDGELNEFMKMENSLKSKTTNKVSLPSLSSTSKTTTFSHTSPSSSTATTTTTTTTTTTKKQQQQHQSKNQTTKINKLHTSILTYLQTVTSSISLPKSPHHLFFPSSSLALSTHLFFSYCANGGGFGCNSFWEEEEEMLFLMEKKKKIKGQEEQEKKRRRREEYSGIQEIDDDDDDDSEEEEEEHSSVYSNNPTLTPKKTSSSYDDDDGDDDVLSIPNHAKRRRKHYARGILSAASEITSYGSKLLAAKNAPQINIFSCVHLTMGIAQAVSVFPSAAAEVLSRGCNVEDVESKSPFDLMRRALAIMGHYQTDFLHDNNINNNNNMYYEEDEVRYNPNNVINGLQQSSLIFTKCIKIEPYNIEYHCWKVAVLAAATCVASGIVLGGGVQDAASKNILGGSSSGEKKREYLREKKRTRLHSFQSCREKACFAVQDLVNLLLLPHSSSSSDDDDDDETKHPPVPRAIFEYGGIYEKKIIDGRELSTTSSSSAYKSLCLASFLEWNEAVYLLCKWRCRRGCTCVQQEKKKVDDDGGGGEVVEDMSIVLEEDKTKEEEKEKEESDSGSQSSKSSHNQNTSSSSSNGSSSNSLQKTEEYASWKSIRRLHAYHTIHYAASSALGGTDTAAQHVYTLWRTGEVTIDSLLCVLARRVERFPFRMDVWRDLVRILGPLGVIIEEDVESNIIGSKGKSGRKKKKKRKKGICRFRNCETCRCLTPGRYIDHKELRKRKQTGDWWGDGDTQDDDEYNQENRSTVGGRSKWWGKRFFHSSLFLHSTTSLDLVDDTSVNVHFVQHMVAEWLEGSPSTSLPGVKTKKGQKHYYFDQNNKGVGPGRGKWMDMEWLYHPGTLGGGDDSDSDENDDASVSGSDSDDNDDDYKRKTWENYKTHNDILPKHISCILSENRPGCDKSSNNGSTSSWSTPDLGTDQDALACESLCIKIIVACHLWNAVHPFVIDGVWHLSKECLALAHHEDDTNKQGGSEATHEGGDDDKLENNYAFRALVWLTSYGLNIPQILQEKYELCVAKEEEEEQRINDMHCDDDAFDGGNFKYDFAPLF